MDYNKSKAENRAINSVKGAQEMGDNGPRRIFGNMTSSNNSAGTKGGKLYGQIGSAKTSSGIGGNMTSTGFPNPPRQSMASGKAVKPTAMKLGGGKVLAKMQPRSGGPKSIRGGTDGGD